MVNTAPIGALAAATVAQQARLGGIGADMIEETRLGTLHTEVLSRVQQRRLHSAYHHTEIEIPG